MLDVSNSRAWRGVALGSAVAVAILVPLFGAPRSSPVTQAEWARMVVRALDLEDALPARAHASYVFSILSWKGSLSFAGDDYSHAVGVEPEPSGSGVVATADTAEVDYRLAVARPGDYRLRLRLAGDPATPATAELADLVAAQPVRTFPDIELSPKLAWHDLGLTRLERGTFSASVVLPTGAELQRLEVVPPCLNPVEPKGGWRALDLVSPVDVAVTAVQALDQERELPPGDSPIDVPGATFQVTGGSAAAPVRASQVLGPESYSLRAGAHGVRALVIVNLPTAGLYSFAAFGEEGQGQRWSADACNTQLVCPPPQPTGPTWRHVLTADFVAGPHTLAVTMGPGAVIERLRAVRQRDDGADYVATLAKLGFDVGEEDPMPRSRVVDAMDFIRQRRRDLLGLDRVCADTLESQVPMTLAEAGGPVEPGGPPAPPEREHTGPEVAPPGGGTGGNGGTGGGPAPVPPQEPASPVTP